MRDARPGSTVLVCHKIFPACEPGVIAGAERAEAGIIRVVDFLGEDRKIRGLDNGVQSRQHDFRLSGRQVDQDVKARRAVNPGRGFFWGEHVLHRNRRL